jgi:hypothetical protein
MYGGIVPTVSKVFFFWGGLPLLIATFEKPCWQQGSSFS